MNNYVHKDGKLLYIFQPLRNKDGKMCRDPGSIRNKAGRFVFEPGSKERCQVCLYKE